MSIADHRPIVAILRGVRPDEVELIGEALVENGIGIVEVPLNSPDPFDSIAKLASRLAGRAVVGAGTVLSHSEVEEVNEAGGTLVVSPNCDREVIAHTKSLGLQSLPGVFSPTEAFQALRAGADGLKFFPASLHGPEGIKAIRAVLPMGTKVYAVGGVDAGNIPDWLAVGTDGFGIGSALFKPGMGAAEVGERARAFVAAFDGAME